MADQTVSIRAVLEDFFSGDADKISRSIVQMTRRIGEFVSRATGIGRVSENISKLNQRLSPLTGRLTQLVAATASVAGIQRAIDLAEEQVTQEERLFAALDNRVGATRQILDLTADLQSRTRFGDEALIGIAATLIEMGTAVDDVDDALSATLATSRQLRVPIEQVAKAIGLFNVGRAGELGERIAQLKELQEQGLLTAQTGLQALIDQFGRIEDFELTIFDRIQQQENLTGDEAEEIGKAFASVKEELLRGFLVAIQQVRRVIQSPEFGFFLDIFKRSLPLITQVSAAFLSLVAIVAGAKLIAFIAPIPILLGQVAIGIIAIVAQVGFLSAILVGIPVLLAGIIAGFDTLQRTGAEIFATLTRLGQEFVDTNSDITEAIRLVREGRITVNDFFSFLSIKLEQNLNLLRSRLFIPVFEFINSIRLAVIGVSGFIVGRIDSLLLQTFSSIQGAVREVIALGARVEGVFGGTSFVSAFQQLDTIIRLADRGAQQRLKASEVGLAQFETAFRNSIVNVASAQREANESNAELANRAANILADAEERATAKAKEEADKRGEIQRRSNERLVSQTAQAFQRVSQVSTVLGPEITVDDIFDLDPIEARSLLSQFTGETLGEARQLFTGILDEQRRAQRISTEDFLTTRRDLIFTSLDEERSKIERNLQTEQERLAILAALNFGAREFNASIDTQQNISTEILKVSDRILQLEEERRRNLLQSVAAERENAEVRRAIVQEIIDSLDKEISRVEQFNQATLSLFELGGINLQTAFDRTSDSLSEIDIQVEAIRQEIERILSSPEFGPELKKDIADLEAKLNSLSNRKISIQVNIAETITNDISRARDELIRQVQEIQSRAVRGDIFRSDAAVQTEQALNAFNLRADLAKQKIDELSLANPELAESFRDLSNSVEGSRVSLEELRDTPSGTFFTGLEAGVHQVTDQFSTLQQVGVEAGRSITNNFVDALIQAFQVAKGEFDEFLRSFIVQTGIIIARLLLIRALSGIFGALGSPANTGGIVTDSGVQEFGSGAFPVPGPRTHRDTVRAVVTPGEVILTEGTADYYGIPAWRALEDRLIPREVLYSYIKGPHQSTSTIGRYQFQTGGSVARSSSGSSRQEEPMPAYIVPSDQSARRFLRGGRAGFLDIIEEMRDDINSRLGR